MSVPQCACPLCDTGRDYWLLLTKSAPKKAPAPIKVVGGDTIKKGMLVVKAQWYLSTSDSQGLKVYTLVDGEVSVLVRSLVQEHTLDWERTTRAGSYLSQGSHLALMSHNYSNVV